MTTFTLNNGHTFMKKDNGYCYVIMNNTKTRIALPVFNANYDQFVKEENERQNASNEFTNIDPITYEDGVTADLFTVETYYAGMTYYVVKKNGVEVYNGACVDEIIERFGFDPNVYSEIEIPRIEALIEEAEDNAETEEIKEVQKELAPKAKKTRRSKDIAYTYYTDDEHTNALFTLTAKQVDFIKHLPDTYFWENGVESIIWVDCLCDDIQGQFANKPMTVGAMISTLCEKGLGTRATDRKGPRGGKATSFALTEMGMAVAIDLGL